MLSLFLPFYFGLALRVVGTQRPAVRIASLDSHYLVAVIIASRFWKQGETGLTLERQEKNYTFVDPKESVRVVIVKVKRS